MGVYLAPELLNLGYEVYITSRSPRKSEQSGVHYIQGNARDSHFLNGLLGSNRFDAIVDFMVYKTDEFKQRVTNLLDNTSHYIFLSSYRVYADSGDLPLDEESPRLLETVTDARYLESDEYALTKARQENILRDQASANWTIVRPAITYSKNRFQLGTMEVQEFLPRVLAGKKVIFPREMLDKVTTMTWGGDVARMIALLVLREVSFGETYIAATAKSHTWREILEIYRSVHSFDVKLLTLAEYRAIVGRPYQIDYDRMFNRSIDNRKILRATGLTEADLVSLDVGLPSELKSFLSAPEYSLQIDTKMQKRMDATSKSALHKFRVKLLPRTRLRQLRSWVTSRRYDGAIVTLTVYNNYGNVIQRYALQRFLQLNDLSFRILDLKKGPLNPKQQELKKFSDKYLRQEIFYARAAKYYKAYVVGSDQVWRHFSVNKGWQKFGIQFLNFVRNPKARRVAYAASFGVDTLEEAGIDEVRSKKIRPHLSKFDAVSVREKSGMDLAKQLGASSVVQTLDPTLLLNASDYERIIADSPCQEDTSEVFFYLIQQTPLTREAISYYENLYSAGASGILPYDSSTRQPLPSIEHWLRSIRDASMVVTDSYHALIFSIIFHREFVVFDKDLGGIARIAELLEPLGLADRIIFQAEMQSFNPEFREIDWARVDEALADLRAQSASWLLESLAG